MSDQTDRTGQEQEPFDLALTLARAAAAFRDADFFESAILFWSTALQEPNQDQDETQQEAIASFDLEQELGLDVQTEEPIELVFPQPLHQLNFTLAQRHTLIALCYLTRHINVRIDVLPAGNDTLTTLGSPQRVYGSLSNDQKQCYHGMIAIIFASCSASSAATFTPSSLMPSGGALEANERLLLQQATLQGNESTTNWQAALTQKRTPHSLPRNFSFLNPSSCTVAGGSIPRNDLDIDALEQLGVRLVITLIKESPLSPTWFQTTRGSTSTTDAKKIRNAFVPIENRKAPTFPEVFEIMMGWCVRAGEPSSETVEQHSPVEPQDLAYDHQRATFIHCGGGKGRAGIVMAAHLIRFGPIGNEHHGYCRDCIRDENVHPLDLDQFRRGLGDQASVAATLPGQCQSIGQDDQGDGDEEDEEEDDEEEEEESPGHRFIRRVRNRQCLNRCKPMMTAKDAMAHLRALRPGSIETVEQEKAVRAYGDWLWKRSSIKSNRKSKPARASSSSLVEESSSAQAPNDESSCSPSSSSSSPSSAKDKKDKKDKTKETPATTKPKPFKPPTPPVDPTEDDLPSEDEPDRARRSGKKGKKGSKQMPPEEPKSFTPPPAHKIIKLPGSGKGSHHQHHLIVQHNLRARQLQRGEKTKKKKGGGSGGGGGKNSKERPSFNLLGASMTSPPRLVVLTGLPGSGKSHVTSTLLRDFPDHFVSISQDELGSRSVCERLLAQNMRHQQQALAARGPTRALPMTVFVDRCNPTRSERRGWYEDAFQPDDTAMVWFSLSQEACVVRVDSREDHPTVAAGKGRTVVSSFAKTFEVPNLGKESWCKTLIEVGDDEGSDRLIEMLSDFARGVGTPLSERRPMNADQAQHQAKARPAFIPPSVLQRKRTNVGGGAEGTSPRSPTAGSMDRVIEEESEGEEEDEEDDLSEEKVDEEEEEDDHDDGEDEVEVEDGNEGERVLSPTAAKDKAHAEKDQRIANAISGALRFASPTGHRPAVKKPERGSWIRPGSDTIDQVDKESQPSSPKGVSFATNMVSYDRPLQKFPRTPHLFDPLTIHKSRPNVKVERDEGEESLRTGRQSAAISRNDLLLPVSALDQILTPKPHQVLTVEEKLDGANIGFSVIHFRGMNGFGAQGGPPPRIRVQNRNHFVHPDDHWQFKKLDTWMETHREDILWLCEGQWRFEELEKQDEGEGDNNPRKEEEADVKVGSEGDKDEVKSLEKEEEDDEDGEEEEYMDETMVLQDGMAPYVLYGEWMFAKHSVEYTGLRSWFVPFDLFDVKTGTFISRAIFRNAIAQTQLVANPSMGVPIEVAGDVDRMVEWLLAQLQSRSKCMRDIGAEGSDPEPALEERERVEGLYFRVDQGDRLLLRAKVVRPDFIAGEERWGMKEQRANQLRHDAHYAGMYDDEVEDEDEDE